MDIGHETHAHEVHAVELAKPRVIRVLFALLLVASTLFVGAKTWNEIRQHKFIGVPIERNTITVEGTGKVVVIPDIANITLGMQTERKTVAEAQAENTRIMNAVIDKVKSSGVDQKDIQTSSYNVSPMYDYVDGRAILRGYQVSQNVTVKVRSLDKTGEIIGAAGQLGANQIGGIFFDVEDIERVKQEARIKAMENAQEKASALADVTDVTLRRIVSFDESVNGGYPIFLGRGIGGAKDEVAAPAPNIETGSNDIIVTVSVTYEIE